MKKRIVAMILLLTISVAGCGTLDEKNITKATEKKEQKQLIPTELGKITNKLYGSLLEKGYPELNNSFQSYLHYFKYYKQQAMTIKLSNGKTYEVNVVANGIGRGSNYLLIEMPNQYPLNALIADFSNVDSFEVKSQDENSLLQDKSLENT